MHPLAPKFDAGFAREKMGDTQHWRNFALRIQHHPDIKLKLIALQRGQCPVCRMPVTHMDTVHHKSYLARCKTDELVEWATPTLKRPGRTTKAPPCADCSEQARCLNLLTLVHDRCHHIIHKEG